MEMTTPWIEKYRPLTLEGITNQPHVTSTLNSFIASGNLPHLLLYGPPGTGKTSTILALARDLFGQSFKQRMLELNASDERGIAIVREKIKGFAKQSVANSDGKLPPFKLIILDEADSMTVDAQSALRRIMEAYSQVTRFCLICNHVTKIIDPIASRCAKIRFRPLGQEESIARLQDICKQEGISVPQQSLTTIVKESDGDMRRCVMMLQSVSRCCDENISDLLGIIPKNIIIDVIQACRKSLDVALERARNVVMAGYSAGQFVKELVEIVVGKECGMDSAWRARVLLKAAEVDSRLVDGADEELSLMDLVCSMAE